MCIIAQVSSATLQTDAMCKNAYASFMEKERDMAIEAIQEMVKISGLSASALAKKANLSHTTVTRPLHQYQAGERGYEISYDALTKLARASGFDSYEMFVGNWMNSVSSHVKKIPISVKLEHGQKAQVVLSIDPI